MTLLKVGKIYNGGLWDIFFFTFDEFSFKHKIWPFCLKYGGTFELNRTKNDMNIPKKWGTNSL